MTLTACTYFYQFELAKGEGGSVEQVSRFLERAAGCWVYRTMWPCSCRRHPRMLQFHNLSHLTAYAADTSAGHHQHTVIPLLNSRVLGSPSAHNSCLSGLV